MLISVVTGPAFLNSISYKIQQDFLPGYAMKGSTIVNAALVLFGSILVILGTLILILFPRFVSQEVSKRTHLGFNENGSYNELTQKWIDPPYSIALQVWTYSVNNLDDVITLGTYPKFAEKGPYTFTVHQRKNKVLFMVNNTRVLYRTNQSYVFNSSLSCNQCLLTDKVTIPNPVFQFIADIAKQVDPLVREAIELVIKEYRETPFITTTVKEMLFDGFEDPVISSVCNMTLVKYICEVSQIPKRIGFFYGQNGKDDGEYLIDTGLVNVKNLGKVYKYNGSPRLPDSYWYLPDARMINGTDQIFPPDLSSSEPLYMFLGQLKRSIYLRYKERTEVEFVPAWRYIVPPELYDPSRSENRGFCNPETPRYFENHTQPDACLPSGFLDMSSTQRGNPRIYLSGSHFYYSPASVYKIFDGFREPSEQNDESQFDIEPTTGTILRVNQRLQINVGMLAGSLRVVRKMRNMIVPVLWFNETVLFDSETRNELLSALVLVQKTASMTGILLLAVGIVLLVVSVAMLIAAKFIRKRSEDEEHLIPNEGLHNDESPPGVAPTSGDPALLINCPPPVIEPSFNV